MRIPFEHRPLLRLTWLFLGIAFLTTVLNGLAYMHARSMTQFAATGQRTEELETISFNGKVKAFFLGVHIPRPQNQNTPADRGLSFETMRVPSSIGSLEAWVVRCDNSRGWVALFHGYADSKDSLLAVAERFHRERFSVILVDFRGSGGSDGTKTTVGYDEAHDVADVAHWMEDTLGSPKPILYGFSMGAAAILRAVALYQVPARALIVQASFDRMLTTVQHRFEMLHSPAFPSAELLLFWGGRIGHFDAFSHNPVDYAARVNIPTLVLHGARDERVTQNEAAVIYSALRGKKSLHVFPTGIHDPTSAVSEQEWFDVVKPFLETIP